MKFDKIIDSINSVIVDMKKQGYSKYKINEYRHAIKILKGDRIVTDGNFRGFKNVIKDLHMVVLFEKQSARPRKTVIKNHQDAIKRLAAVPV